ncbi:MAG: ethylbenzene dehydrogenase-related protein [Candidatus Latescibacterota bacterium]
MIAVSQRSTIAACACVLGLVAVAAVTRQSAEAGVQQQTQLVSQFTPSAPVVDGVADPMWADVPAMQVQAVGGANAGSHQVSVKSLYDAQDIYLLVQWDDPTESLQRFPWVKQDDGTWEQLGSGPAGDENEFYEDKLAFIWNTDAAIAGFDQAGCMVTCHVGEAGKPYGNKYTANEGEMGDIWHWKSVRTGSVGSVDDQYVDAVRYSETAPEAGRHSDPRTGGGYSNNVNEAGDGPAFTDAEQPAPPYWIVDAGKQPFTDTFSAGDEVAGIIVAPLQGDRGDVAGMAQYSTGGWTLEISRPLVTGSQYDVQFDDLGDTYHFGVAVFDNAQVRHSFQTGVSALTFGEGPTPVAGTTWGQVKQAQQE